MKYLASFIFVFGFTLLAQAHAFYFSFAEVQYNSDSKKFEISIEASTHDVEKVLRNQGLVFSELEMSTTNPEVKAAVLKSINLGFELKQTSSIALHLIGFDVMPNGLTYFYLESESTELTSSLSIRFDWLMDEFEEQQNKITFIANNNKQTAVFLPTKRTNILEL
ncbi:MAG: hypothetical protein IT221_09970 [Fluviicola sp.]|nr:hypothetical protein [Fluviicola sp.]